MPCRNVGKALVRRRTDGKYLILRGSVWPERPDRSQKPDLPGGLIEDGETVEQGCAREIMEEAGIAVDAAQLQLVQAESFLDDKTGQPINRLIFLVELDGDPPVTLSWEHEGYTWMTAAEVAELDMRQPYPAIFTYLQKAEILV